MITGHTDLYRSNSCQFNAFRFSILLRAIWSREILLPFYKIFIIYLISDVNPLTAERLTSAQPKKLFEAELLHSLNRIPHQISCFDHLWPLSLDAEKTEKPMLTLILLVHDAKRQRELSGQLFPP